jgi:hypothetical protein
VDQYFSEVPTTRLAAPTAPVVAAERPTSGRSWWPVVATCVLAAGLLAGALFWVLRPSPRANYSYDRFLGRVVGLQLPVPVTASECQTALVRFRGITSPGAKRAFVHACLVAHGTGAPLPT